MTRGYARGSGRMMRTERGAARGKGEEGERGGARANGAGGGARTEKSRTKRSMHIRDGRSSIYSNQTVN